MSFRDYRDAAPAPWFHPRGLSRSPNQPPDLRHDLRERRRFLKISRDFLADGAFDHFGIEKGASEQDHGHVRQQRLDAVYHCEPIGFLELQVGNYELRRVAGKYLLGLLRRTDAS